MDPACTARLWPANGALLPFMKAFPKAAGRCTAARCGLPTALAGRATWAMVAAIAEISTGSPR